MIPDVAVAAADRNVLLVRLAVRFGFVFLALDQLCSLLKIGNRAIELANRDIAMSPVPVHAVIVGKFLDAFGVNLDRPPKIAAVRSPSTIPDDFVGIARLRLVIFPGLCELLERFLPGCCCIERLAGERQRLRAVGNVRQGRGTDTAGQQK